MNYTQALAYVDLLAEMGIKAGLEHTRTLAKALGNPQDAFPPILVAGTNGKGSVAATLASILWKAGFRAGLYTSPHLVDVRERIRVGGRRIPKARFAALLRRIRHTAEDAVESGAAEGIPTHFEALTLLAFLHFQEEAVDAAVLEVGLGGRWDCTNVAEPVLSVITSLSMDHEEWLGKGIRSIAREKAGILRKGVPAVTSSARPEALEVLARVAEDLGAPLGVPGDCRLSLTESGWEMECPEGSLCSLPLPALPGLHQVENTALACRAALSLRSLGWDISDDAVREGIRATRWPGRLQKVAERPDMYLDGAHNPEGCQALRLFAEGLARPRVLVLAAMRDKPIEEMAAVLLPAFDAVVATQVPMERCAPAMALPVVGRALEGTVEPDLLQALQRASERAGPDGSVVVAGSLYLVGHALAALGLDSSI